MRVTDIMTPNPETVHPDDTLQAAAQRMDDLNVGVLPVVRQGRLMGMLTDRDIVIRSTAAGQDPRSAKVLDAMTDDPRTLAMDMTVLDALRLMKDQQLRRLPVVDSTGGLIGIVSLGDLADAGTPEAGDALEAISSPAEPDR
jgi:CBS domain-containing protein